MWWPAKQKIVKITLAVGLVAASYYVGKNGMPALLTSCLNKILPWASNKIKNFLPGFATRWAFNKITQNLPKLTFVKSIAPTFIANYLVPGIFASEISGMVITHFLAGLTGHMLPIYAVWPLILMINGLLNPNYYGEKYLASLLTEGDFNTAAYLSAATVMLLHPLLSEAAKATGERMRETATHIKNKSPALTWKFSSDTLGEKDAESLEKNAIIKSENPHEAFSNDSAVSSCESYSLKDHVASPAI